MNKIEKGIRQSMKKYENPEETTREEIHKNTALMWSLNTEISYDKAYSNFKTLIKQDGDSWKIDNKGRLINS